MRIEVKGCRVLGYVDYNGKGEIEVITLYVDNGKVEVGSSMCLPVQYEQAMLVLNCYSKTFEKAKTIAGV